MRGEDIIQRTGVTVHAAGVDLATHDMTDRQVQMLLAGSLINLFRARQAVHSA